MRRWRGGITAAGGPAGPGGAARGGRTGVCGIVGSGEKVSRRTTPAGGAKTQSRRRPGGKGGPAGEGQAPHDWRPAQFSFAPVVARLQLGAPSFGAPATPSSRHLTY